MTPCELRHPNEQEELIDMEEQQLCIHGHMACPECELEAQWDRALDCAEAMEEDGR